MGEDDFKYLSQECDTNVLKLVKQKEFYPYVYISGFENLKQNLQEKESLIVRWQVKQLVIKSMNLFLRFGIHFK